ncbi:MAG: regulatory protein RecX [Acidobacteria bacterium]|nr:regulatory protein RecX [Acidobacteriota bacterium]
MAIKPDRRLEASALWDLAVRLLAGRAHTSAEIRSKLRRRAGRAQDVEAVLGRLRNAGYLDEHGFAESFAAARLENQHHGRMRVLQDLRRRGVAPALAAASVEKAYRETDELALIEDFIRRRLKPEEGAFRERKDFAAAYRKLLRAGFSSSNSLAVLKKFARDPDLAEGYDEIGSS